MRFDSPLLPSLLIFATALALRLCMAQGYPPAATPEIAFYRGDAPAYHQFATSLAAGRTYDQGLPFHPPLLAWIVTPIYRSMAGSGAGLFLVLRAALSIIGALVAVLVLLLARRLGGPLIGLWAGTLAALHFGLAATATTLNTENLNAALELGAILLLLGWRPLPGQGGTGHATHPSPAAQPAWLPWLRPALAGVLAGLAALTRAEDQLFILLLAIFVAWWQTGRSRQRRRLDWRPAAVLLAGALLVISPWAIRNARTIDAFNASRVGVITEPLSRLAPVTCYGGLNFALANHPDATGGFSRAPLPSPDGVSHLDLRQPEHLRFMRHGIALGLGYVASHPVAWLELVAHKLGISLEALRIGYGVRNRPVGLSGRRRAVDFIGPASWTLLPFHLLLVGLGIAALTRRRGARIVLLLHLAVIVKLVTVIAFFGYVRLLIIAMPVLLIDLTAGVALVSDWLRSLRRRRTGTGSSTTPPSATKPAPATRLTLAAATVAILILALALVEGTLLARQGQEIAYAGETALGSNRVNLDGDLELWPSATEQPAASRPSDTP